MLKLRSLFARPIDRKIEEVIKVDQRNEEAVLNELQEYVVTESLKDYFKLIYDEIITCAKDPREGIGVWISGFFGSGKSSFAKVLGYTVGAIPVLGRPASEIFKENVKDTRLSNLLDLINRTIPIHPIIFDVGMERGVRTGSDRITEIMYKALLRELDYAEDFDLAELEISLEQDGRLKEFEELFQQIHGKPWRERRKIPGIGINEASLVLHRMDPDTYPQSDTYSRSIGRADIDPNTLSKRAFELAKRRKPGKALIFIVDEVGQYVSRSVDRMLDLQAVVQAFGREGKNRTESKEAISPFWIVVTSQEKLNEVVDALESRKIELARLQDRFRIAIDLKQTDITEVTAKRVLDKTEDAKEILGKLFDQNQGRIKAFCTLERTHRDVSISKEQFVDLYPYLPYQIELCIDIVAGLRSKRETYRHIGGSNRTIIKQAQQMMINPRTMLAEAPVGTLVTLDMVYELLDTGNLLPSEISREINLLEKSPKKTEMAIKVAKAVALLEVVKDLPRTVHNISVVLHPSVQSESIENEVKEAIRFLEEAKIIKESEEGYKLLSAQEKRWDEQRRGLEPKPAERNRIILEEFKEIFRDPKVVSYKYKDLKILKLAPILNGTPIESSGNIQFNILTSEDRDEFNERLDEARKRSLSERERPFWVVQFDNEVQELVIEYFRSQEMVKSYERLASQNRLSKEESSCLYEEKIRKDKISNRLRKRIYDSLTEGTGFFRGVQFDSATLGKNLSEIIHALLGQVIPKLFPKLEMGVRPLKGNEVEKFLSSSNLNGLPPVFYEGDEGLFLVTKEKNRFVPNPSADICRETYSFIQQRFEYGERVSGKMLESHFEGHDYGWSMEILQLALSVLLRSGKIKIEYQNKRIKNYTDPLALTVLTKAQAFRSSTFLPREAPSLETLTTAVKAYEDITGKEVDVEEGAISTAFKEFVSKDREATIPIYEKMKVFELPGTKKIEDFIHKIDEILKAPSGDCIRFLEKEGKDYKRARHQVFQIKDALTDENINLIKSAKKALNELWPQIESSIEGETLKETALKLKAFLSPEDLYTSFEVLRRGIEEIYRAFEEQYKKLHNDRSKAYKEAIKSIKEIPGWNILPQEKKDDFLKAFKKPICNDLQYEMDSCICSNCKANLIQMKSEIVSLDELIKRVNREIQNLELKEDMIERVEVSRFFNKVIETPEDVESAINELRNHILKLIKKGIKVILE